MKQKAFFITFKGVLLEQIKPNFWKVGVETQTIDVPTSLCIIEKLVLNRCVKNSAALLIWSVYFLIWPDTRKSRLWTALANLFLANVLILYPLKTPENKRFLVVFRGYGMKKVACNGLLILLQSVCRNILTI